MSDQGGMLDDIESNMVKVSTKVADGTEELRRADKTQRSSRNRVRNASLPTPPTSCFCGQHFGQPRQYHRALGAKQDGRPDNASSANPHPAVMPLRRCCA